MKYGDNPEIVMDAFRMARSGNYRNANALKAALQEAYPEVSERGIRDALTKLAQIIERQHAR